MRRTLPLLVTFLSGLAMMACYYSPRLEAGTTLLTEWFSIVTAFASILGVTSLVISNGKRIARREPEWGYNAVLLGGFAVTLVCGLHSIADSSAFDWIFRYIYTPLTATMFSLLAFFIASAAFRAFKAKTVHATLLLATAFIVMLGRVPAGEYIYNSLGLSAIIPLSELIDHWIMGAFNTAGQRAVLLGASIGLVAMSLKIMLGIERSYLGGD
jgi:hypothetical protein